MATRRSAQGRAKSWPAKRVGGRPEAEGGDCALNPNHESEPQKPEGEPLPEDGAEHVRLVIRRDLAHRRLDLYLQTRFPQFSRTAIQKLIAAEAVTVNDRLCKASTRLAPGDVIDLILPPPQPKELMPEPIPLAILFEDEYLLAVNKQAGLIVHPARGNPHGTLVNGLAYYARQLATAHDASGFRPGIVHRLDRDTTGVLLVAKTDEAHWRLARQFEARRVHKEYVAVVHGRLELDADRIDAPLARDPRVRERFAVAPHDPAARPATTTYRVLTRYRGYTLAQLEPQTGRTHQLRVHMSHIRHPIVGDTDYGGHKVTRSELADRVLAGRQGSRADRPPGLPPEAPLISRQALHARLLRFRHPVSNRAMEIVAPAPADLETLIAALEEFRRQ